MSIYNSLTKSTEPLPILVGNPTPISWYTCGPTVYDHSHIGHARTYMMVDLMRRTLEMFGYKVTLGMNITDIDDKIIKRAKEEKTDVQSISKKYTSLFFKDLTDLNIRLAEEIMNVTDYITEMTGDIQTMIANDLAYLKDDSVYFNKTNYLEKGFKMPGMKYVHEDDLEVTEGEDFALWKRRDKETDFGWDSPFGFGFPGWHLECSVISHRMFPNGIDIHSGGVDLAFPHHENEIIQNNILDNDKEAKFIKTFVHVGHLHIDGRKMAKTLKNFIPIRELLQKYSAETIRMYFMLHHYRKKLDYSTSGVDSAASILQYIVNFVNKKRDEDIVIEKKSEDSLETELANLDKFLLDDFNFPDFIKSISAIINNIYANKSQFTQLEILKFIEYVKLRLRGLGFHLKSEQNALIIDKINDFRHNYRRVLKEGKEIGSLKKEMFVASDQFRADLATVGIKLEDKKL